MQTIYSAALEKTPRTLIVVLFLVWKLLLLTVALLSPGPGYDTSTQLLFKGYGTRSVELANLQPSAHSPTRSWSLSTERLVESLTRWDAIYFASIAERGYVFEQEWAFGWGFTRLLSFLSTNLPITSNSLYNVAIHGALVANVSHMLSVLILYQLGLAVVHDSKKRKPNFAFIAAALHIIAPAGIFLVAPYTEAPFSLLNFLGHLLYVYSWSNAEAREYGLAHDLALITSGLCFGLSATVRGNGLLSGILPFIDVVVWFGAKVERAFHVRVLNLGRLSPGLQAHIKAIGSRRIPATILAGLFAALGFATPQYLAFQDFCAPGLKEKRPWCQKLPPSIYSWVQNHYWNVGFLKYWTLSNAPLFLIAAPVLYVTLGSAWRALNEETRINTGPDAAKKASKSRDTDRQLDHRADALLFRLALPQFALSCAALTTFHVQVITRLSSGYPLWYLILAQDILDDKRTAQWVVRWMVMYAIIQAALFASFLPPA